MVVVHLGIPGTDGNAIIIPDGVLVKVTHQNAPLLEAAVDRSAVSTRFHGKQEVGAGVQHGKAQLLQLFLGIGPGGHDLLTVFRVVILLGDGLYARPQSQPIHIIGVGGKLHRL